MLIDNDELVTMTIMTETKPGVPNVNGIVYSKEAYDEIVKRMNEQQRFVPIIKEIKQGYCIGTAPGTIDLRKMCNEELGCKCLGSVTENKDETEFVKVTYTQICGSDATRYKRVTNYVLKSDLDALFNNENLTDDEINTTIVLIFDKASGFKDPICGKTINELTIDPSYCVSGVNDTINQLLKK